MKKKTIGIAVTVVLLLIILVGCLCFCDGDEEPDIQPVINNLNITMISKTNVINENTVVYNDNNGLSFTIEPASEEISSVPVQTGKTREGIEWKSDGNNIIVDGKKVTVNSNDKKKDNGKIAAVVTALAEKKGYTKNVDDYNHNYAVYYIEEAECMLYYPKQLVLVKEGEDQSLLFRDPRSDAELSVFLKKNEFSSMDEVESLIANTENNRVLATGTDWFSAEIVGKSRTQFSVTGLGNRYEVNAELTYENKYSYVFEELRSLIKCRFIENGIWVSNAKSDTTGQTVEAVKKSPGAYDPVLKRTSTYLENLKCVVAYPDIFSKMYSPDDENIFFTDPVTGAYIAVSRSESDCTIGELQEMIPAEKSDLTSDHSLKAADSNEILYITVRDGYIWFAELFFDEKYSGIYSEAYDMLEICIEGDSVNNTEVKEIFYPAFNCYVTVPVQFTEYDSDGDSHFFKDTITGLYATLSFTEISDKTLTDNLFDMFEVVAEDDSVLLGEDYVKWHNKNGLFIGAAGCDSAGLIEITYPNAFDVYRYCLDDIGIYFTEGYELETDADDIRMETNAVSVLKSAEQEPEKETTSTKESFGTASESDKTTESNTAKTLIKNGADIPENKNKTNSSATPNRILIYRTESDYLDVITDADEWIYEYERVFPDPKDTRTARYYTILYSMKVLAYNGYSIPGYASDVFKVAGIVDNYINLLIETDTQIDSALGEGVISVFEVLCYYLGIEDVPVYVIDDYDQSSVTENITGNEETISDNNAVNKAETAFRQLPFSEIPDIIDDSTVYGDITVLSFEPTEKVYEGIHEAINDLLELDFSCSYQDIYDGAEEYWLRGFMPETDIEMLIIVFINDYEVQVLSLLADTYFIGEPGTLSFYNIEYSFDILTDLYYNLTYFLMAVRQIETDKTLCYRFTQYEYDTVSTNIRDWQQGAYVDYMPDYAVLDTIEVGYIQNGEFISCRTYCYLAVEGITLGFDEYGIAYYVN